jgi:hypothetical protein
MSARENLLCRSDNYDADNLNKFAASKIAPDRVDGEPVRFCPIV